MTKFHKIYLFITIALIIILLSPFIYLEVNKKLYENKVTDYLTEEQGYNKEDLTSVDGVFVFKTPNFYVTVVFENEPYVEYIYFAYEEVTQFDYEIVDAAYEGLSKEDLKNLDSNR